MHNDQSLLRGIFLLLLGLLCIIAGIFSWAFPSIKPWWRATKRGELLNKIVMIIFGIWIIIGAFEFFF